jgi:hypothetical protein
LARSSDALAENVGSNEIHQLLIDREPPVEIFVNTPCVTISL